MRTGFFIVYILLFFCKNAGAVQHAYTEVLQHGHYSLPKSDNNKIHIETRSAATFDYALVEDADDGEETEFSEDHTDRYLNFNWLSHYLERLLKDLFKQPLRTAIFVTASEPCCSPAPIYVLNRVFRI